MVEGLSLASVHGDAALETLAVDRIVCGSNWYQLLAGNLTAYAQIDSPRVLMNLPNNGKPNEASAAANSHRGQQPPNSARVWRERLKLLPSFRISSLIITEGEVRFPGIPGQDNAEIRIEHLWLKLENLTNSTRISHTTMARFQVDARLLSHGNLNMRGEVYPLADTPTFNLDLQGTGLDLTELRPALRQHANVEVHNGSFDIFLEATAADGVVRVLAKPVFEHLRIDPVPNAPLRRRLIGWSTKLLAKLGRNEPLDRIATEVNFEGSIDDPNLDISQAALRFIRNGFLTAERAAFENQMWFARRGRTAREVQVHWGTEARTRIGVALALFKDAFVNWRNSNTGQMAAALSYYTAFSMAPLLILAISIAGLVIGHTPAEGKIIDEIAGLVGQQSAAAVKGMVEAANQVGQGWFAAVAGVVSLVAGASGVISELKAALNSIWGVREPGGFKAAIKRDLVTSVMLIGVGFLMTVSLLFNAVVAGLGDFLSFYLSLPEFVLQAAEVTVSFVLIGLMFSAMSLYLPNVELRWRDVWVGGAVTAFLFEIGKVALGVYIGKKASTSAYGAAGAVLIVLLWVYYSGLIFYYGAQFTKVYVERFGSRRPKHSSKRPRQALFESTTT